MKASEIAAPVWFELHAAPNDINGNPRRAFVLTWGEYPDWQKAVVDDDHCGENWIGAREMAGLITERGSTIKVKAKQYNALFKTHPKYENA